MGQKINYSGMEGFVIAICKKDRTFFAEFILKGEKKVVEFFWNGVVALDGFYNEFEKCS